MIMERQIKMQYDPQIESMRLDVKRLGGIKRFIERIYLKVFTRILFESDDFDNFRNTLFTTLKRQIVSADTDAAHHFKNTDTNTYLKELSRSASRIYDTNSQQLARIVQPVIEKIFNDSANEYKYVTIPIKANNQSDNIKVLLKKAYENKSNNIANEYIIFSYSKLLDRGYKDFIQWAIDNNLSAEETDKFFFKFKNELELEMLLLIESFVINRNSE